VLAHESGWKHQQYKSRWTQQQHRAATRGAATEGTVTGRASWHDEEGKYIVLIGDMEKVQPFVFTLNSFVLR
jgi:hypothetical protein